MRSILFSSGELNHRILMGVGLLIAACVFGGTAIMANTDSGKPAKSAAQTEAAATDETPKDLPDPLLIEMVTSKGNIVLELDRKLAPFSVQNFINYIESGFYSDTIFHRVIEGFMIQGGGFTTSYQRKNTQDPIQNEANNGLKNHKYTIAMARTSSPHSATAQFFINAADNDYLDHSAPTSRGWGYAVFGRVVAGKDVVDTIAEVDTGAGGPFSRDAPREQIVISEVRVQYPEQPAAEAGAEPAEENTGATAPAE